MRRFIAQQRQTRLLKLAIMLAVAAAEARAQEAAPIAATAKLATPAAAKAQQSSGRRIVVDLAERKLALVEDGHIVKIYRVAVGTEQTPSPVGEFKIIHRVAEPTYYAPGVVIPAGVTNPLGPRWLGLSEKGFGIHGTNRPSSIGHSASHGCIRLRNRDIQDLFARVRVGDTVVIAGADNAGVAAIFATPAPAITVAAAQAAPALSAGN